MNTLLQECVPARTDETRWMVGGRHAGKLAARLENAAMDVPVQYAAETAFLGLSEGRDAALAEVVGW